MNCKDLAEFLMDYVDGTLPPDQMAAFELHMQKCPPCVHYIQTYKQCIAMGKICIECEEDAIPAEVPDGLVRAILAARKTP